MDSENEILIPLTYEEPSGRETTQTQERKHWHSDTMSGIQDSAEEARIRGIRIHSSTLYLKLDNARTTSGDGLLSLADDSSRGRSGAHDSSRARSPSADADSQTPAHGKGSPTENLRVADSQGRRCGHYRTTHSALMQRPTRHRSRCSCCHSQLQHRRHGKHNARPLRLATAAAAAAAAPPVPTYGPRLPCPRVP